MRKDVEDKVGNHGLILVAFVEVCDGWGITLTFDNVASVLNANKHKKTLKEILEAKEEEEEEENSSDDKDNKQKQDKNNSN